MAYGYGKTFYTLGNVITEATFLGFAVAVETDKCTHKRCGYIGPYRVCKKCGEKTPNNNRYSWYLDQDKCSVGRSTCLGKLDKTVHPAQKVKCKMERFRTLTQKEICHPNQRVDLALLEISLAGRSDSAVFIVELNDRVFLPGEMRADWNKKEERYTVRPTDKRSWSKMDINKVENKEAIIDKIWDTFK
jgi:hypothetical protein